MAELGPTVLRLHLDAVPLWRGNHVGVRQLVEDFAQYPYRAVRDGVGLLTWEHEAFAFADDFAEDGKRYQALRSMQDVRVTADSRGLVVNPAVARKQIDDETPSETEPPVPPPVPPGHTPPDQPEVPNRRVAKRFHATATLSHTRIGPEAGRIAEEVVSHLDGVVGSDVRVILEIEVNVPDGVPEHIERVVTENSASLKLDAHAFEES